MDREWSFEVSLGGVFLKWRLLVAHAQLVCGWQNLEGYVVPEGSIVGWQFVLVAAFSCDCFGGAAF